MGEPHQGHVPDDYVFCRNDECSFHGASFAELVRARGQGASCPVCDGSLQPLPDADGE